MIEIQKRILKPMWGRVIVTICDHNRASAPSFSLATFAQLSINLAKPNTYVRPFSPSLLLVTVITSRFILIIII